MKTLFTYTTLLLLIASCKKEKKYTCTCTISSIDLFTGNTITSTTEHPITDKKKKAEQRCEAFENKASMFQSENCDLR